MTWPDNLDLTVTIDGNNITAYIEPYTMTIGDRLGASLGSCNFTLRSDTSYIPSDWDEIIVLDGATRIFGGYVQRIDTAPTGGIGGDYEVECSEYAAILHKLYVKEEFEDSTDQSIIQALFTEHLPTYDTTDVEALLTYPLLRINRKTIAEVLDLLAANASADWFIDYDQSLKFGASLGIAAPFSLSHEPDFVSSFPYYKLEVHTDGSEVVNRVEVVGGAYLSEDTTLYAAGTGESVLISVPFRLSAPSTDTSIEVYRNDGTASVPVWTQLTVKVGYIDELSGANEVLYYYQEQVLEAQAEWPNLPNAVKIIGRYPVPLRSRHINQASIDHYGRYFDHIVVDDTIIDKQVAKHIAQGILVERSMAQTVLRIATRKSGLRAGQLLNVTSEEFSIDDAYIIHSVTATVGVNGATEYEAELGTHDPDLIDLMVRIAKGVDTRPVWRDDETLDDFLATSESIILNFAIVGVVPTDTYKYAYLSSRDLVPTASNPFVSHSSELIQYEGLWDTFVDANDLSGGHKSSDVAGAFFRFSFQGTGFSIGQPTAASGGNFRVWIDGVASTYNSFSASLLYQQEPVSVTGLTQDRHVVEVECVGTGKVFIDYIQLVGTDETEPVVETFTWGFGKWG